MASGYSRYLTITRSRVTDEEVNYCQQLIEKLIVDGKKPSRKDLSVMALFLRWIIREVKEGRGLR